MLVLLLMASTMQTFAGEVADPQVSVQLSESRPYLQQTVILRLRVTHSPAVTTLDVEPVHARDFSLEPLSGPPRTTRPSGPQQMTTDFVYALTPLSSGSLELPSLQVRAVQDSAGSQAGKREVSLGSGPVSLEVLPLPGEANVLLPLYALDVALRVDPRQPLQVGRPFELSIVQQATGADGDRLGDVTALLKHPDFRIYPGQSRTSGRLTRNGQLLQGQRIDTLTLVPLRDGELQLPAITLPWWDITRGSEAQAGWPGVRLQVRPEPGSAPAQAAESTTGTGTGTGSGMALWPAVIGMLFAFAAGWWLRGYYRREENTGKAWLSRWTASLRRLRQLTLAAWQHRPLRERRRTARIPRGERAASNGNAAMPHRQAAVVGRFVAQLPGPLVPWIETARLRKHIEAAVSAGEMRQCLLAWGSEVLGLPAHTTLMELGRTLVKAYPKVNGARISRLLAELDASLYGAARSPNLVVWKQAFMSELGHVGQHKPFRASPLRHQGLPVLNPG